MSALLLWLGWMLVGNVVGGAPRLPQGTTVTVHGTELDPEQFSALMRDLAREEVLQAGLIAFPCLVVATALLVWTTSDRVLRPLQEVTATARRLSAESLGERIQLTGPRDEVADLADTFDEMLDRLQASFEAQRRFVANASHELRTPLAVVRTELDVTLSDPEADAEELRRMAGVVRQATLRAEQLVEGLLLLARTDGGGLAVREAVDLTVLVMSAWHAVRTEAAQRGIEVTMDTRPELVVGDPALLERVAGNLLENAVRHNVDGGWIKVFVGEHAGRIRLVVSSSGPELPASQVPELFEPFRRGGVARTAKQGAGLGLSIVRAVVNAHGGEVHAAPVPGGGLSVQVDLPAATATLQPPPPR